MLVLTLLLVATLSTCARAQGTLRLSILDESTRQPVPEVEAYAAELTRVFTADRPGTITLDFGDTPLPLTVTVFAPNYTTTTLAVRGDTTLTLPRLRQNLGQVTVLAERQKRYALERLRAVEGTAIYAGKKTEVIRLDALTANLATNQARQIYGQVTGLNIYENDDAGLQLGIGGRGLDPNRTASFNTRQNGYDISADVLGYPESYYTPPAEALARIQVVRGAASLQYGTQFGGLVNFIFRGPERERKLAVRTRQTVGSNGLFTSFNEVAGTVGQFGYYGFYNRKQGDGFRPNSAFDSDNAHVHLEWNFSERSRLSAEYTYLNYLAQQAGGLTDAQFYDDPDFSNRARNYFSVDWNLFNLRYDLKVSDRTSVSASGFGLSARRSAVGFRTNRVSQTDRPENPRDLLVNTFDNVGAELRGLHRSQIGGQAAIALLGLKVYRAENTARQGPGSAGMAADFSFAEADFPDFPNQSSFDFPNRNVAVFAEHIFYLSERLSLTPGVRHEWINTASAGSFRRIDFDLVGRPIRNETFRDDREFRRQLTLFGLGVSYRRNAAFEFFANASQNYRSVTFNDIRVVNPSFQIADDISDEDGYTVDVGVRGNTERVSYAANGFLLRYNDRLGEVLTPQTVVRADGTEAETGRIVRLRGNIGEARIVGLETLVEAQLIQPTDARPLTLSAFSNLSLTTSEYLMSEINGVVGNEVEFVPAVNWRTGLRFGYGDFLGSVQYAYLSEQFTDASNAAQNREDNQSGIVGTIPAYGVADLSLAYRWRWLTVETGVNNLLNNRYFTRRATGYPGPGIIPSAPRTWYLTVGASIGGR